MRVERSAPPLPRALLTDLLPTADNQDEAWCNAHFLLHAALRSAVAIRLELLEVMQRIELPVSPPAFGCQDNCTNVKRALISGFFLNVSVLLLLCVLPVAFPCVVSLQLRNHDD